MIFPTTHTCSNTLPYPYDVHSWAEYAFYFVTMFWRRISMFCQFPLHKQGTSCKNQPALDSGHRACHVVGPPCQYNAWEPRYPTIALPHTHYRNTVGQWLDTLVSRRYIGTGVQLHGKRGVQNLALVDFYMKSLRELAEHRNSSSKHSDEIKRIFSPRVNDIGIRKCVRTCIRRREDHFEQNFAN
ncbi:hypothetical protein SFRURICE_016563 [Spodoptera frugiperda]|nr:hypothetical protein SFRURICE_016563 [Spodoptera frugiperda]